MAAVWSAVWARKFLLASLVIGWSQMGDYGVLLLVWACGGALLDGIGVPKAFARDDRRARWTTFAIVGSLPAVPLMLLCHNAVIAWFHDTTPVREWIDWAMPVSHAVAVRIPSAIRYSAELAAHGYGHRVEPLLYLYATNGLTLALYTLFFLANMKWLNFAVLGVESVRTEVQALLRARGDRAVPSHKTVLAASAVMVSFAVFGFSFSIREIDFARKSRYGVHYHVSYAEFIASPIFLPPVMMVTPFCLAIVCFHVNGVLFRHRMSVVMQAIRDAEAAGPQGQL